MADETKDGVSKSWFIVFNNPEKHGYEGEPVEIIERLIKEWVGDSPTRTCAMTYCLSAEGLPHVHMVVEDVKAMRFTAVKKAFPSAHLEPTRGNKDQAVDYIEKRGKYEEKGEKVVYKEYHGEIKGAQGKRRDLEIISELVERGMTPKQVMNLSFSYRRYENMIKSAFFDKRNAETPFIRDVKVYWHVGESGTGKTYYANEIVQQKGEDAIYFVTDYSSGSFDMYNGEEILFLDEFRGQFRYSMLLSLIDKYKVQVPARYHNVFALWNEVHISSVLPLELVYERLVDSDKHVDTLKQLLRRITYVIYHYKENGEYKTKQVRGEEYHDYDYLKSKENDGFLDCDSTEIPSFFMK